MTLAAYHAAAQTGTAVDLLLAIVQAHRAAVVRLNAVTDEAEDRAADVQFCAVLDDIVDQTLAGTSDGNAFAALALIARELDQYAHRRQLDA